MIRTHSYLETCFSRVKTSDNAEHLPVLDDKVKGLNHLASAVTYEWNLEIDNNGLTSDKILLV